MTQPQNTRPLRNETSEGSPTSFESGAADARLYQFANKIRGTKVPQTVLEETLKFLCEELDLAGASINLQIPENAAEKHGDG